MKIDSSEHKQSESQSRTRRQTRSMRNKELMATTDSATGSQEDTQSDISQTTKPRGSSQPFRNRKYILIHFSQINKI